MTPSHPLHYPRDQIADVDPVVLPAPLAALSFDELMAVREMLDAKDRASAAIGDDESCTSVHVDDEAITVTLTAGYRRTSGGAR
ncbi:hypothetical protein DRW48_10355 [Paracoccus suum]|uniref:Uncharacterized protein n=1 Tax=Paracoccus suum TaxID=2259340 RepID=A0A344PKY4_9RHOB|nr:hypothetical protein [Paracoccus suum]AXC50039.1 hypothetical protein DRW48_10355 [Paracoccus suum]